jgi:hypothetical protein
VPDSPRSLWTPAGEHAVAQPFPMARYAAPAGGVDRSPAVREMRLNRQATEKRTASVRRTASYGDGFAGGGFGGGGGGGSQINLATSRPRDPMWYWRQNNLPYQYQDESEASLIRQFASLIYMTHPVIASCIDTYSLWPMTGMKITAKDPKVEEFHQTLFFDTLDYESYLPSVLKQTWLRGEAFPLGQFDDTLGIWEDDQLIDPDSVKVIDSPFFREPRYEMRIPESIRQIVRDRSPEWEFRQLVRSQPDIVRHAEMGDYIPVDNTLMRHIALKMDDFHPRGVSILMRAFRSITQEEMLNAALDACLVAGTPILTQQGVSYIEDIKKGDLVLTHQGRYRKVLHTMKREANEPGVTIKPRYEREITMTGEHPVLVRRKMVRPGVCYHCRAKVGHRETVCDAHALTSRPNEKHRHRRGICRICGETASSARTTYCQGHDPLTSTEVYEGWMPSKDIAVFDEMWHPHQPGREKVSLSLWETLDPSRWVVYDPEDYAYGASQKSWYQEGDVRARLYMRKWLRREAAKAQPGDILRYDQFGMKYKHFATEYKLSDDLLWLIGLFVADGTATLTRSQYSGHTLRGTVSFALGIHEVEYQDRVVRVLREVFGLEGFIRPEGDKQMVKVSAYSLPLAMWFRETCGAHETKRFPLWAFGVSTDQARHLVSGWLSGDGHRCPNSLRGVSAYRTVQEQAARLIRLAGYASQISALESRWPGNRGGGCAGVVSAQIDALGAVTGMIGDPSIFAQSDGAARAWAPTEFFDDGYWVEVSRVVHHQVQETVYNFEVQEDNSYCAPLAVHNCASRLYTPLILVKLGASASDMGTDVAWVPSEEQLEDFNAALDMALLGDFRVLTSHFATDISAVFGKEVMPSFAEDFDRIMERQLMVFGLSETLLTGASDGGTYAADALNRDVVSILLKRAQRWMQRFFRDRAEPVAEAQEHFDYEESAGVKKVIYRDVKEVDEESGEVRIVRKPKLMLPELSFDVLNLNDRDTERQFVEALAASGLPISRRTRLRSLADIDLDDEITALSDENVDMAVATAETAKRTYLALKATGAPIPQNLIDAYEPKAVTPDAATVASEGAPLPDMAMDPPPETMGLSASPEDYAAAEAAGEMPPDAPPASGIFPASTAPLTLMSPVPAEGAQRPPESDEARGRMPKAARRSRTLRAPQKAPETKGRDIEGYGIYEIG